jgi:hypothetical protein
MAGRCDRACAAAPDDAEEAKQPLVAFCNGTAAGERGISCAAQWHVQQLRTHANWDWGKWFLLSKHKAWLTEMHSTSDSSV